MTNGAVQNTTLLFRERIRAVSAFDIIVRKYHFGWYFVKRVTVVPVTTNDLVAIVSGRGCQRETLRSGNDVSENVEDIFGRMVVVACFQ